MDNFLVPFSSRYPRIWVLILLLFFHAFLPDLCHSIGSAVLEVRLFLLCPYVATRYFKEAGTDLGLQPPRCPLCHRQRADKEPPCLMSAFYLPSPSQKEDSNFTACVSFVNSFPPAFRVLFPVSKKIQTGGYICLISSRQMRSFMMFKETFSPGNLWDSPFRETTSSTT